MVFPHVRRGLVALCQECEGQLREHTLLAYTLGLRRLEIPSHAQSGAARDASVFFFPKKKSESCDKGPAPPCLVGYVSCELVALLFADLSHFLVAFRWRRLDSGS